MSKHYIILAAVIAFVILLLPTVAKADNETDVVIDSALSEYDLSGWDEFSDNNTRKLIKDIVLNGGSFDEKSIISVIIDYFLGGIKNACALIIPILAIAIISGVCSALLPDGMGNIGELTEFILTLLPAGIVICVLSTAVAQAKTAISQMTAFSEIALPALSAMLIASGQPVTAGTFSPLMTILATAVTSSYEKIVVPFILICGVLAVISCMSQRIQLKKLYVLGKSIVKWCVGVSGVLYMGIATVKGLASTAADGLTVRTTKYVIDKSLPIAGNFVSGTVDTVWACASAVKSAAGIAFVVIMFGIVAKAFISLIATMLSLRAIAALCEPISQSSVPKLLSSIADVISQLVSVFAVCCAMFIITVGICFFVAVG